MAKEKVFIVLSHKHSLKQKSNDEWEVTETVEFVDQLRKRHLTMSSAIGDYLNRKMLTGERFNMTDYTAFEDYVRRKYKDQIEEIDKMYANIRPQINQEVDNTITDSFGNKRSKTVFDV